MHGEDPFRIILLIVTVVQTLASAGYLKKARAGATVFRRREEGILFTVLLGTSYAGYGAVFVAYLLQPRWMAWAAIGIPSPIRYIGVAPLAFGGALMLWGLHFLGSNLTISVSTKDDHTLMTTGPYGWVRHPLYAAVLVQSVGVVLLMANWLAAVTAAVFWSLLALRTRIEERKLIAKFGDEYRQYMKRTGQFFPRIAKGGPR